MLRPLYSESSPSKAATEAAQRMMEVVEKHGVNSHLTIIPFERIPEIVKIYEDSNFQGRIVVKMSD
ncbi:hypothetical protein D6C81_04562 [Aureobasidium pullulans]|nr:hypothetical protein D6C81_04562 [Aureobasidium pullulans]